MSTRDSLLEVARRLTIDQGGVPSLNVLAAAAGVSKGGLTHHFPTRAALVDGLTRAAIEEVDESMAEAGRSGAAAATWVRLASPAGSEAELFHALAAAYRSLEDDRLGTLAEAAAATRRWEDLIAAEVGDALTARAIRLLGDGITYNALVAAPVATDEIERLVERVVRLTRTKG